MSYSSTIVSYVEVFDGTSWSAGPDLTTARYSLGLASLNGLLYAVGGDTGLTPLSSVEVFGATMLEGYEEDEVQTVRK